MNGGVQEAFVNQKRIELEIRALTETIARFGKQTDQWLAASHAINTSVKVVVFLTLLFLPFFYFVVTVFLHGI